LKFKLDENLGKAVKKFFSDSGHDVKSVFDENIQGSSDELIFQICQEEKRCLVTLDLDFANIIRFPPDKSSGIVVLKPSGEIRFNILKMLTQNCLDFLSGNKAEGNLMIVEETRIRIHKFED